MAPLKSALLPLGASIQRFTGSFPLLGAVRLRFSSPNLLERQRWGSVTGHDACRLEKFHSDQLPQME